MAGALSAGGCGVPGYMKAADRAKTITQMRQIECGIAAYRVEHRKLPDTLDEVVREQFSEVPKDAWGRTYLYARVGEKEYTLRSLGADGKEGGK